MCSTIIKKEQNQISGHSCASIQQLWKSLGGRTPATSFLCVHWTASVITKSNLNIGAWQSEGENFCPTYCVVSFELLPLVDRNCPSRFRSGLRKSLMFWWMFVGFVIEGSGWWNLNVYWLDFTPGLLCLPWKSWWLNAKQEHSVQWWIWLTVIAGYFGLAALHLTFSNLLNNGVPN